MNYCLLIPLTVGILCAVFGFLLGRLTKKQAQVPAVVSNVDEQRWKQRYSLLEKELEACRKQVAITDSTSEKHVDFDADAAKAVFGKTIQKDDLKIVEGIGPKIEQLFHQNGINTWEQLAQTTVLRCRELLKSEGVRFAMHKPDTWPKQAAMAYQGEWEALKQWQDTLKGGN